MVLGGTYSCTIENMVRERNVLTLLLEVPEEVALRAETMLKLFGHD